MTRFIESLRELFGAPTANRSAHEAAALRNPLASCGRWQSCPVLGYKLCVAAP
ncbi:MAG TPA: hypothetical protein VFB68_14110 [Xanthobacteraceae bacterium]|jgi:hypothetical protein|nr:hypothetical protein [Xanthobacteraceae bacterium]HZO47027.1 hypothetical protein [Xanthobacteraceae bacterium]